MEIDKKNNKLQNLTLFTSMYAIKIVDLWMNI